MKLSFSNKYSPSITPYGVEKVEICVYPFQQNVLMTFDLIVYEWKSPLHVVYLEIILMVKHFLHVDTEQYSLRIVLNFFRLMENHKVIMNGPIFFQLLIYVVFIAMNLLQFNEVIYI